MTDYLLQKNEYGEEKYITDGDEFIFTTTNILFNKPGFIPEIPFIGINLNERRYLTTSDTEAVRKLNEDITSQIKYYYPNDRLNIITELRKDAEGKSFLYVDVSNLTKQITATVNYVTNAPKISVAYKDYNK